MENIDDRRPPFDRLKDIMSDGEISKKAYDNLDELLGIKEDKIQKTTLFSSIKRILLKIDNFLFKKPSRKWNTHYQKR